ncbi:MAG: carbon-nitrogen hydrolase family protein [Gammaproteobacteria bacterium]|nr:MAG: carbon-nitrogen hydrolase family protein [Gammaproteobacteria bacterium]
MTKVAAIQMCSSHLVDENLETAEKLITEAAENGAKLIVLPEMFAMMGLTEEDKVRIKEPLGHGKIQFFLASQAKKNKAWLVGGTIPLAGKESHKVGAACLVFDDQGNRVARYDKMHLFDANISSSECYQESHSVEPGDQPVVVETPFGQLGLAVCYDVRFPELFRCLFKKDAELIALPSAFTVKTGEAHWELLARSRAVENFCYVIGACQGGTHSNGRKTYGHSVIVEPWGKVIAKKDDMMPGVIYADIELEKLHTIRKTIPVGKHQRIF